jgi:hypothetical protein
MLIFIHTACDLALFSLPNKHKHKHIFIVSKLLCGRVLKNVFFVSETLFIPQNVNIAYKYGSIYSVQDFVLGFSLTTSVCPC